MWFVFVNTFGGICKISRQILPLLSMLGWYIGVTKRTLGGMNGYLQAHKKNYLVSHLKNCFAHTWPVNPYKEISELWVCRHIRKYSDKIFRHFGHQIHETHQDALVEPKQSHVHRALWLPQESPKICCVLSRIFSTMSRLKLEISLLLLWQLVLWIALQWILVMLTCDNWKWDASH